MGDQYSVIIDGVEYPCMFNMITGNVLGITRPLAIITLDMTYEEASEVFVDDLLMTLKIVYNNPHKEPVERELPDYKLICEIIDHGNGALTIKVGALTDLEKLIEIKYGGVN